MEVWLKSNSSSMTDGVDFIISSEQSESTISIQNEFLYKGNSKIGAHVHIDSEERQQHARSLAGTVEWIFLTFEDW